MKNPFLLGKLKEIKGSAVRPNSSDNRTIVLFCENNGDFESVPRNLEFEKAWPKAKEIYRSWWRGQLGFKGGEIKITDILSDTQLAHLVTCVKDNDELFFDKKYLEQCFDKLGKHCSINKRNVHINKIGTDSEWQVISNLIEEHLLKSGVNVFVYSE